jgi:signal transduction histidine kinase
MFRVAQTMILSLWMGLVISSARAVDANEVLTSAAEIRSLTVAEAAQQIPVCVTGVVTLFEPTWGGSFIMQDATEGVFVTGTIPTPPAQGDLIEVTGVTTPGGYSRAINLQGWKKLGTAPLPEAQPISAEDLIAGPEDANRVEVPGVVISASLNKLWLRLIVASGASRFSAFVLVTNQVNPNSFLGVPVCIRGTASTSFTKENTLNVSVYMPWQSDLIIESTNTVVVDNILTTAKQVLSLTTAEAAEQIPVCVTGVVTVAQSNWGGRFFVQDSTCGVFVDSTNLPAPLVGDVVEARGLTSPGGFAPDIEFPHFRKLGTAPLPAAKPVSMEQFMSGSEDGERIELSGVVTVAEVSEIWVELKLKSGADRAQAFVPLPPNFDPNSLIGATIRLRGTAAASFNANLRHLLTVILFSPQSSDLIIDQSNTVLSKLPLTPLNHIAQYRQNNSLDSRIRVRGIVTYQRPGQDIFLHDNTGGLQIQSADTNIFNPGDVVEAIGFPDVENFLPVLKNATLISTGTSEKPVIPEKVSFEDFFQGFHHADVVTLQGKLLDRSLRPLPTASSLTNGVGENILTLKSEKYFFSVEAPGTEEFDGLASIPLGSMLEVSGLCVLEAGENGAIESVHIMPIDASSIRILEEPSWWTPQRLLIALGILLAVSLVVVTWTVMIHRKNTVLQSSIAEKVKAQEELQKAHDQLETRVQERTKELKFEMSARKEAEIQFEAILSERKRLAQELHDTLLQGFTGVGLKLDAVTNSLPPSLATTKDQMQKILEQSDEYLSEARRAVWQLRSPSLQSPADFPEALKKVSERALEGTGIALRFTMRGDIFKLTPDIEDNFLRICEEGVTNAVRHASPTEVEVTLEYTGKELRLRVRDNGCGFDPHGQNGGDDGHFGLVGMEERTKRVAGNLSINSRLGRGTEITITVGSSGES